jgi:hypothetical protein
LYLQKIVVAVVFKLVAVLTEELEVRFLVMLSIVIPVMHGPFTLRSIQKIFLTALTVSCDLTSRATEADELRQPVHIILVILSLFVISTLTYTNAYAASASIVIYASSCYSSLHKWSACRAISCCRPGRCIRTAAFLTQSVIKLFCHNSCLVVSDLDSARELLGEAFGGRELDVEAELIDAVNEVCYPGKASTIQHEHRIQRWIKLGRNERFWTP